MSSFSSAVSRLVECVARVATPVYSRLSWRWNDLHRQVTCNWSELLMRGITEDITTAEILDFAGESRALL